MLEPSKVAKVASLHVCLIIEYMPSQLLSASFSSQWTCLQESQSHRVSPLDLYSSAVKSCCKCHVERLKVNSSILGLKNQHLANLVDHCWVLFLFRKRTLCDQHVKININICNIKRSNSWYSNQDQRMNPGFLEALQTLVLLPRLAAKMACNEIVPAQATLARPQESLGWGPAEFIVDKQLQCDSFCRA